MPRPRAALSVLMRCARAVIAFAVVTLAPCVDDAKAGHNGSISAHQVSSAEKGFATYYASRFEGRRTASGATFRNDALVAAHPTLPFGTLARVTNLSDGRSVTVRIVDRGPGAGPLQRGVIVDLSQQAARELNMMRRGRVRVALEVLGTELAHTEAAPLMLTSVVRLRMDTVLASMTLSSDPPRAYCEPDECDETAAALMESENDLPLLRLSLLDLSSGAHATTGDGAGTRPLLRAMP